MELVNLEEKTIKIKGFLNKIEIPKEKEVVFIEELISEIKKELEKLEKLYKTRKKLEKLICENVLFRKMKDIYTSTCSGFLGGLVAFIIGTLITIISVGLSVSLLAITKNIGSLFLMIPALAVISAPLLSKFFDKNNGLRNVIDENYTKMEEANSSLQYFKSNIKTNEKNQQETIQSKLTSEDLNKVREVVAKITASRLFLYYRDDIILAYNKGELNQFLAKINIKDPKLVDMLAERVENFYNPTYSKPKTFSINLH